MFDIYLNLAEFLSFTTFSYFIENLAKLSVILQRSFGVRFSLDIELPKLSSSITWNVSLDSTKLVFIKNIGVLFVLSHYIQNLMFNVSLHKVLQNIKVMFHNNDITIFHINPVDLIGQWSHAMNFINIQRFWIFWSYIVLFRLLFLKLYKQYFRNVCIEVSNFIIEIWFILKCLFEYKLSSFLIVLLGFHWSVINFI